MLRNLRLRQKNGFLIQKTCSENSFNKAMLNSSIEFILLTQKFNNPLF